LVFVAPKGQIPVHRGGEAAMIRIVCAAAIAVLAAGFVFAATPAHAQGKKKDPRCVANFHEACMKRCNAACGRLTGCGQYCQQRKVELGCP
jgi:hypothetical protein